MMFNMSLLVASCWIGLIAIFTQVQAHELINLIPIDLPDAASPTPNLRQRHLQNEDYDNEDAFWLDFSDSGEDPEPTPMPTPIPTKRPTRKPTKKPTPAQSQQGETADDPDEELTFFAIGDVPYSDMEACLIPHELKKLAASGFNAEFLIHLGDIRDGKPNPVTNRPKRCTASVYKNVATIFENSPVPTFFIPGENGWLDCANAENAITFFRKNLSTFHERTDLNWPALGATVTHHPTYPEFYAFMKTGILFLGQGLPGVGRNENAEANLNRPEYLKANAEWTIQNFDANAEDMKAVVIFAHSGVLKDARGYLLQLKQLAQRYPSTPILFLQDEHFFNIRLNFMREPNLYMLALDDTVTPTAITVRPNRSSGVFNYDRRCPCAEGHRPTNMLSYQVGHRCYGACASNQLCWGEDKGPSS